MGCFGREGLPPGQRGLVGSVYSKPRERSKQHSAAEAKLEKAAEKPPLSTGLRFRLVSQRPPGEHEPRSGNRMIVTPATGPRSGQGGKSGVPGRCGPVGTPTDPHFQQDPVCQMIRKECSSHAVVSEQFAQGDFQLFFHPGCSSSPDTENNALRAGCPIGYQKIGYQKVARERSIV